MNYSLRKLKRADYSSLNDVSPDIVRVLNGTKPESTNWNEDQKFEVEVIEQVDDEQLRIHYVGYSKEWDTIVPIKEIIHKIPPPAVNGPTELKPLLIVLKGEFRKQLGCGQHQPPMREIRIETNLETVQKLKKVLNVESFTMSTPVAWWYKLIGRNFSKRILNAQGDYCSIVSEIHCRITTPRPDIAFQVVNGILAEHWYLKNPILVIKFAAEKTSSMLDTDNDIETFDHEF